MKALVIAEFTQNLQAATLNAVTAAAKTGAEVHLLVAGSNLAEIAKQGSEVEGVTKVLVADHECYKDQLPENLSKLIVQLSAGYDAVFAPATTFGKNLLPRVAALKDVEQISDITEVVAADEFKRPIYAGNAIATVKSADAFKVVTVRASAFDKAVSQAACVIEQVDIAIENSQSKLVKREFSQSDRPELTAADVVISGGRGMGNGENFALLENVADKLNAAIGASRAAVDAGFVSNDLQVGQTGKIVAPNLYIAVGISGAIQHLAGMKESKYIVAINKDEDAPIFSVADYGLVADLFDVLPELAEKL